MCKEDEQTKFDDNLSNPKFLAPNFGRMEHDLVFVVLAQNGIAVLETTHLRSAMLVADAAGLWRAAGCLPSGQAPPGGWDVRLEYGSIGSRWGDAWCNC